MNGRLKTLFLILAVLTTSLLTAQIRNNFFVHGRHLYDHCGEQVILRGINNPNIWFEKNGGTRYDEIAQTGANVVRIVWETSGTAGELDEAITNCIDAGMIPMVELHDATGDLSKVEDCVDYWTSQSVALILKIHSKYLLLNIANEPGDGNVTSSQFTQAYQSAITQIRNSGIHVPLVIDAPDWGKNINILQSEGPGLIQFDPDHNLLFSIHMWWPRMYGYTEADIVNEIKESVDMGLPLIVGEFSQMHGECSTPNITAENSIAYKTIIRECEKNEIGYIAWSFFGNCNKLWDMSTSGTFASLNGWGLEVAVSDTNSIQNTSVRPYSIRNNACDPNQTDPTAVEAVSVNSKVLLHNNYPNPFSGTTLIEYSLQSASHIELAVYNSLGEQIGLLVDEHKTQGTHSAQFNASGLPPGIYFYSLTSNSQKAVKRMLLVR